MALTAAQISGLAVALLTRRLVLPMTVSRLPGGEFAGSNGDTITVRVRQPRSANIQSTPGADVSANFSAISETPVNVSLAHLYDGVNVTDEELSLELVDFGMQVTEPQVAAIAVGAEDQLAAAMNGLTAERTLLAEGGTSPPTNDELAADIADALRDAREALSVANVPAGDRYLAVAPDILSRLLLVSEFVRADATGDARSTAIRDATMGRIYGFTVVESPGIAAGSAVAYHRSGFAFANRTPVTPRGVSDSATATEGGVGMRHIFQYHPGTLSDQSVVSTFAGASAVDGGNRVFRMSV